MKTTTRLARSIVALATVLTSLLVLPTPASATTFVNGSGPTGNLWLDGGPGGTPTTIPIPLAGPPTYGCPTPYIEVDVTPVTGPTASVDITNLLLVAPFSTTGGGTWVAVMTRTASTPGTSATINPLTGLGLSIRLQIYTLATGTLCGPGSLVCTLRVQNMAVSGQHTAFPTTSGVTHLVLSSTPTTVTQQLFTPCLAPFFAYIGTPAQLSFVDFGLI